jgi:apolipoprotein N-acyltransferase
MVAPLIILGVPGFPGGPIEATAPQALIYGWVLQFGLALVPYFARRTFLKESNPALGGSWLSVGLANVGSALIWAGIFLTSITGLLHGVAYLLFAGAMLAVFAEMTDIVRKALHRLETLDSQDLDGLMRA